jgi:XTP/dITP diphosphohydrolase
VIVRNLLLGSQNAGKLAEMRALVDGLPFHVMSPAEVGLLEAPAETGTTFAANAALKARHYSSRSGELAVADDSGISVDAMDGRPGLFSSRFGGEGATDEDRNQLLLKSLEGVSPGGRGARFTSAVAVARGDTVVFQVEEHVVGEIALGLRGKNGFGYDPLFFYAPLGRTFGELSADEKALVSHRGKAFRRLRAFLETFDGVPRG